MSVSKDEEGNIYVSTPDSDYDAEAAADRGDAIDDNSSSSGSSSSSSSDPTDPDNAKEIIVTGDASEGEEQTIVGTGDTESEAKLDAATNQSFDAEEGTEIDTLEKRLSSDPRRTGKSVTVTGDASKGEEQTVVGIGESRFESEARAARNPGFDADEGTRVDALESAMDEDQGDGTESLRPLESRGRPGNNNDGTKEDETIDGRIRGNNDNLTDAEQTAAAIRGNDMPPAPTGGNNDDGTSGDNTGLTPFSPDTQRFQSMQDADDDTDLFGLLPGGTTEESLETSFQMFQAAEKAGKKVKDDFPDQGIDYGTFLNPVGKISEGFAAVGKGIDVATSNGFDKEDAKDFLEIASPLKSDQEKQAEKNLASGAIQEAAELPAVLVGAPGAFGEIAEEEDTTVGEAVIGGAAITAEQVKKNPRETFTEEIGGELLGFGVPGSVVLPDSVTVPESIDTPVRFAKGDLGSRATDTRAQINLDETDVLRRGFKEAPEGQEGRVQVVEGRKFTEGGTELSTGTGFRFEEPLSRTEFLKEKAGIKDQSVSEALNIGGTRKGQARLTKNRPEEPDNVPGRDTGEGFEPDDVFLDDSLSQDPVKLDTPDSVVAPDFMQFDEQTPDQRPQSEFKDFQDQGFEEPEGLLPEFENPPETRPESREQFDNFIFQDQRQETREIFPEQRSGFEGSFFRNRDFDLNDEQPVRKEPLEDDFVGFESQGEFAESLTAQLQGIEADADFNEEEFIGTGFDIRPLI